MSSSVAPTIHVTSRQAPTLRIAPIRHFTTSPRRHSATLSSLAVASPASVPLCLCAFVPRAPEGRS